MRSIWNGSVSFGLVSIPIKLFSASEERKIDLDMLDNTNNSLSLMAHNMVHMAQLLNETPYPTNLKELAQQAASMSK